MSKRAKSVIAALWRRSVDGDAPPSTVTKRSRSSAQPTPSRRRTEFHSATTHARALLDWLSHTGFEGEYILARDLRLAHEHMCSSLGWHRRPWSPVGAALRQLTGGRKYYMRVDGQRLRAYPLPAAPRRRSPPDTSTVRSTDEMPELSGDRRLEAA